MFRFRLFLKINRPNDAIELIEKDRLHQFDSFRFKHVQMISRVFKQSFEMDLRPIEQCMKQLKDNADCKYQDTVINYIEHLIAKMVESTDKNLQVI